VKRTRSRPGLVLGGALSCLVTTAPPSRAENTISRGDERSKGGASAPPLPSPLDGLGADLHDAFLGTTPLVLDALAVGVTATMARSGADHSLRVEVQDHLASPWIGDTAYYAGYVLPAVLAPGLYLFGVAARDPQLAGAGSAAVQALVITVVATGALKLVTGRPFPLHGGDPHAVDRLEHPEYAREFRPFSWQWAWPSGHTSASIALAASLTGYSRDPWVALASYPIALFIGAGMIIGDRHWASDVVAGALIGQGIGFSVGSSFRARADGRKEPALRILPMGGEVRGLAIVGAL
jgi:membrane-associated phospholipid phosphatase